MGNCKHDLNKKVNKKVGNLSDNEDREEETKGKNKKNKKDHKKNQKTVKPHGKNKRKSMDENDEKFQEAIEEEQQIKENFKKSRHNKQKKIIEQEKMREGKKKVYDLEKSIPHRWVNLTQLVSHNEHGENFKIDGVVLGVMNFGVVLSSRNESLKYHKKSTKDSKHKVRLVPIETILIKLEKSLKYPIQDFTVIYQDRFEGNLEASLSDFLESSDIPSHRILMLLKQGEVVWDRKEKINKFKFY
uniref:MJ1316 RNA cyclic group end recognition domain-containing protein n=1 Tax=Euplotes harpa TaxID=151035 RepID=A0A7S3JE84_9SPIT|mmetsp:Transcript_31054/g.35476  ORF Transcript_31054/g.35476 Transcript_31054/m.35476 type:complete len:244 (+) Transcript_31054:1589-2320(+)